MDPQPITLDWQFPNGFYHQPAWGGIPGTYRDALNVWLRGQIQVSDRGSSAAGSGGGASPLMVANGQAAGMLPGPGNGFFHLGVPWFAGVGDFLLDGAFSGTSTGKVMLRVGGTTYAAGLARPLAAPGFAPSVTASSKFNGAYAVAYCDYRATTGAKSTRSALSLPIAVRNKKGTVTFPADPLNGTTHRLLFGTRKNFAGSGVVFRITTIDPVPVGTLTIEIDYQDGDLGDLAPLANDPAPTCTHVAVLGGVIIALTSGGMCYPSHVSEPEAFDLGQAVRLPNGEAPTGVLHGVDGGVLVSTRNTLNLLILSGNPDAPIIPRGIWSNTGFAHGNAFCLVGPELYGMSSTGVPVRTQGADAPDYSFGEPVLKRFLEDAFTGANTYCVFDERNGAVLYCSGTRAWPFMLATQRFGGPIALSGPPTAVVAIGGNGKIQIGSGLNTLDTAGANPSGGTWFMQSAHRGAGGKIITLDTFRAQADSNMTMDLLKDLTATTIGGPFPLAFTAPHGDPAVQKLNDKVDSVAFKVSGTLGNQQFFSANSEGTVEPGMH